jgi:hypothetical protein
VVTWRTYSVTTDAALDAPDQVLDDRDVVPFELVISQPLVHPALVALVPRHFHDPVVVLLATELPLGPLVVRHVKHVEVLWWSGCMVGEQAERRFGCEVWHSGVVGGWRELELEAEVDGDGRRCLPLQAENWKSARNQQSDGRVLITCKHSGPARVSFISPTPRQGAQ